MSCALTTIYLNKRQSLIRQVLRIVPDRQIAEDLAQEAYIRTSTAIAKGPVDHIEAFLQRTARNLALDHLRRRAVRLHLEAASLDDSPRLLERAASPSYEDMLAGRQELEQLIRALQSLPKRVQSVVVLARVENWTNRRIAEHLGISERTVFSDLKMAMGHCRDAMMQGARQ